MRAMLLRHPGAALEEAQVPAPPPEPGRRMLRVECCAVCRTDLHIVDGELKNPALPLIPGHQIVGRDIETGARYGVPWLGWTCGTCDYCNTGRENLCERARFTGYTIDGGYAEYAIADARFCFPIPPEYSSEEAAPLLCGGLIGFRAYRMAGEAKTIAFYGFGSAAQILVQIAQNDGRGVFAFTRAGDDAAQQFAISMGAVWAGSSEEESPEPLDAAIIFAPAGELVPIALRNVKRGGRVICAGIHMSDIPSFPYSLLWEERSIHSVANLTRRDGTNFFDAIRSIRIETRRTLFPLEGVNDALTALRSGAIDGTAVIQIANPRRNV